MDFRQVCEVARGFHQLC